nr:immunoglobulin light chain junction region [Macaca mulatta]MOW08205.1 immunoglobulin light chain junction region [Macaca mulatta]MOW08518.1 immunoglobulin light chain junction region [Macaca mulatta]MOW08522.1 immunoglobulin light chain junction region [Macaca mulatta]MOW08690.1 immunoglobulin light chain junction region [Macaca mulatta]
CLQYSTSPYTF